MPPPGPSACAHGAGRHRPHPSRSQNRAKTCLVFHRPSLTLGTSWGERAVRDWGSGRWGPSGCWRWPGAGGGSGHPPCSKLSQPGELGAGCPGLGAVEFWVSLGMFSMTSTLWTPLGLPQPVRVSFACPPLLCPWTQHPMRDFAPPLLNLEGWSGPISPPCHRGQQCAAWDVVPEHPGTEGQPWP